MHKILSTLVALSLMSCTSDHGTDGAMGDNGDNGDDGADGADGTNGQDGSDGTDGADGSDGPSGVTAITLERIGRYESGIFDEGASEIVSYDPASQRIFQVNASAGRVDIVDLAVASTPIFSASIDVAAEIAANTAIASNLGSVNSVAVSGGVVAAVIAADEVGERGVAAFFSAADAGFLAAFEVGFQPDSVSFSPDGQTVVVANEGEPNDAYTVDPVGSVTVIRLPTGLASATVSDLDFAEFNTGAARADELDARIRVFGQKPSGPSTVAEDIEPEFVTFSPDSTTAFVSLQENNGIAVVDVLNPAIESVFALRAKDHQRIGNELDASDRDGGIRIRNWPVLGLLQPDAIAAFDFQGQTMILTANEGDTRDYEGFSEEARIRDLVLDPVAFPDAVSLQSDENLGRLLTTTANGDTDGDGDYDELYSIGGRSFSIVTASGERVYDSGSEIALLTAFFLDDHFNADNDENDGDTRSDAKGAEPEAVAVGKVGGALFAFIGLERSGGLLVYNISNPYSPRFVQYLSSRDFAEEPSLGDTNGDGVEESNPLAGDLGPESIVFVAAADSPTGSPLVLVGNEVSGTTTIYQVGVVQE